MRSEPDPARTGTDTEVTESTVPKYCVRARPGTRETVCAGAGAYW